MQEPTSWAGAALPDLNKLTIRGITVVEFRPEEPVYQMDEEQMRDGELRLYQYVCYSCLATCGDRNRCFTTVCATRKSMRLGATTTQQEQMKFHAKQHSIIWGWARQQDR